MKPKGHRRRKRPIAVTLAGSVALIVAFFHIYHGFIQLHLVIPSSIEIVFNTMRSTLAFIQFSWKPVIELFLSILALFVLLNFFRLRRWTWIALVLWVTINITVDLITYFYAIANFLSMVVNVILAFSLLQSDVQIIFGIRKPDEGHEFAV
jgi:hypothetical protein